MNGIRLYISIIIIGLVQIALSYLFTFRGVSFNLIVIFITFYMLSIDEHDIVAIIIMGIVADLFAFAHFGVWTLLLIGAYYLYKYLLRYITNVDTYSARIILSSIIIAFLTFGNYYISAIYSYISNDKLYLGYGDILILLLCTVYSLIITFILWRPMKYLFNGREKINIMKNGHI